MNWGKGERRDFPPLAAYVADDPNVELAVNRMRTGLLQLGSLRGAAKTLGNLLFPAALAAPIDAAAAGEGRQGRAGASADVRIRSQESEVRSQSDP